MSASMVGVALLGEPIRANLVAGIVAVFVGIWIATTQRRWPNGQVDPGEFSE